MQEKEATPQCESFMHLHLGIDAAGLPDDLEIHHIVVNDWDAGERAAQLFTFHALSGGSLRSNQ